MALEGLTMSERPTVPDERSDIGGLATLGGGATPEDATLEGPTALGSATQGRVRRRGGDDIGEG